MPRDKGRHKKSDIPVSHIKHDERQDVKFRCKKLKDGSWDWNFDVDHDFNNKIIFKPT